MRASHLLFSVIIPTRNRAPLLREALDALLHQAMPASSYEIIVVDDASSDETPQIITDFARRFARAGGPAVLGLSMAANSGPAVARNRGIQAARGEVLAFTDDDCLPDRTWLERMAAAWEREGAHEVTPLGGMGGRTVALAPLPAPLAVRYMGFHHWLESPSFGSAGVTYVLTSNCCYLREAVEAVGGFDPRFGRAGGEDADLGRRIVAAGYHLAYNSQLVVRHRVRHSVGSLAATAYRYGAGEGYSQRKAGHGALSSVGAALALSLLRLGWTPLRAARYHRKDGLPWREALSFAALDDVVSLSAAAGLAKQLLSRRGAALPDLASVSDVAGNQALREETPPR